MGGDDSLLKYKLIQLEAQKEKLFNKKKEYILKKNNNKIEDYFRAFNICNYRYEKSFKNGTCFGEPRFYSNKHQFTVVVSKESQIIKTRIDDYFNSF